MASLRLEGAMYSVTFRVGGQQFRRSLKTKDKKKASALLGRLEATLFDIESGKLTLPEGCDAGLFVLSDGKLTKKVEVTDTTSLGVLTSRYIEEKIGLEENTMVTTKVHIKHLLKIFGVKKIVQAITFQDMQRYVRERSKHVAATTIKKEIGTFSALWAWGKKHDLFTGLCPISGLEYAKGEQKAPFQTWQQIEQTIKRGGLSTDEAARLWDCLWLDLQQLQEFLDHVHQKDLEPWVYPLMVMVAHTGCRRSEALRSEVSDFDFENGMVRLREKKKDKTQVTFRHVPMTPLLRSTLREWIASHDNRMTFGVSDKVTWLRFQELTSKNKWKVLKGFHVFRHSYASNLARLGTPDRMIDVLIGHQTEEMRKRYQHLHPEAKQSAIASMFGQVPMLTA